MSTRTFITEGGDLPRWSNPISHAVVVNNMCFVSGQLSVNKAGDFVPGTIEEEAKRAFSNVFEAIKVAALSFGGKIKIVATAIKDLG